MSLQDPLSKMSKSDENVNSKIMLTDDNDTIIKKLKRAVTDSGSEINGGVGKEGIANLISLLSVLTGKSPQEIETDFEGKMYGDFKLTVADAVIATIEPIRNRYKEILADREYLDGVLIKGKQEAEIRAEKVLQRVKNVIGLNIFE
jgi:tryptophanyl-tRNA synthetase